MNINEIKGMNVICYDCSDSAYTQCEYCVNWYCENHINTDELDMECNHCRQRRKDILHYRMNGGIEK